MKMDSLASLVRLSIFVAAEEIDSACERESEETVREPVFVCNRDRDRESVIVFVCV